MDAAGVWSSLPAIRGWHVQCHVQHSSHQEQGKAHLFGAQDTAQALRLLPPRPRMAADLDQHICLWDIDGVVTNLGQEDSVDLQSPDHGQASAPGTDEQQPP